MAVELRPEEIELMRESFARLVEAGGEAESARHFYARLFELAPETRPLFRTDISEQGMRFMRTLRVILDHLGDPERLAPYVRQLAIGHALYGVRPEHFAPMGEALIDTMRAILGDELSDAAAAAWRRAYAELAAEMRRIAGEHRGAAGGGGATA